VVFRAEELCLYHALGSWNFQARFW